MRKCRDRTWAVLFVAALALMWGDATADAQRPDAIIAGRYLSPDGTLEADAAIVLSSGKIKTIRPADQYADALNVVRHEHAVVSPGLIDLRSVLGALVYNRETAYSIDPGVSAVDCVDPHHRDFRAALRAGITTVLISPADNNLVSGAAVSVKTATTDRDPVLRSDGPLMFALGSTVWQRDRAPTSRIGSLAILRDALEHPQRRPGEPQDRPADNGWAPSGHKRLAAFVEGRLDGIVVCDEAMDVDAALRTFADIRGSVAMVYTGDVHELGAELAAHHRAVIVGPYDFGMSPRTLATAGAYAGAGASVAFAGGMPRHPGDALRITAALAVRHGMDPAKARQAMTTTAAAVAGVADRVGAIRPGADADLVVFSDDPLRLDARVIEVYVDGVRVYRAGHDSVIRGGGER